MASKRAHCYGRGCRTVVGPHGCHGCRAVPPPHAMDELDHVPASPPTVLMGTHPWARTQMPPRRVFQVLVVDRLSLSLGAFPCTHTAGGLLWAVQKLPAMGRAPIQRFPGRPPGRFPVGGYWGGSSSLTGFAVAAACIACTCCHLGMLQLLVLRHSVARFAGRGTNLNKQNVIEWNVPPATLTCRDAPCPPTRRRSCATCWTSP